MKIVVITESGECAALAGWIAENALNAAELERWTLDPMPDVAEQVLDALAAQWLLTPADILIFPAGALGDELATRLAWRLHGGSVCQVQTLDAQQGLVTKSHWGNALTATLQITARPLCLSLARQPETSASGNVLPAMTERRIAPTTPPGWLDSVESIDRVTAHPLLQAGRVLVVGQGRGDADAAKITALGRKIDAEVGYSRARVMNGGFDAERVIGISGHLLAPDVCIVAGASGAAALMAGVRQSRFVVAINSDASAPVFSQADVGIVDDWLPVLEALAAIAEN
ncbi:electron transfer flavoprotein [Citrobacter amalonaticus]|uniref:Electron transfer flavoprotein n=1 Tax=Citrobacter amalonaticus TaxID=35703 RepID=A0A2S4RVY1_CITAM|nr:electron transfer flavoprotein subunit alpha/FixB family protein [Citrobacter amalonaticus]POT56461.1 electron transfer flavoprotein [Citrobacter amalonaticus]POT74986.1 electron transfer flavoprotein [Citrobacter amalonaticus]POU64515.1 electron transfer flavoprotein [Citrobacter amalonaticus]POV04351.1 electron transfer flavoprotein [Citrobacter amalonaticus]